MIEDLKPYPEYKDSGLPWLGEVPVHWVERRAKYFFREVDERSESGNEQGRLKVCPGGPWRGCQHWVRSAGLSAPNARKPLCCRRSARTG
jgi:type I restriction enzyme S subunit